MSRTQCEEDRRMEKFECVFDRWERRELSQAEAAEILGRSERQFRRYIDIYRDEGLEGLRDGRLGRVSGRAIEAEIIERILGLYRTTHRGWNVKHFHEHMVRHHNYKLSYSCLKNHLQAADLVTMERRRGGHRKKRERKPCAGMMLHQDGSREVWLAGQPMLDLIVTMDDATSEIYSAFLCEEEGTMSSFRGLLDVTLAHGLPSSFYTDRGSHYFYTPEVGGKVDKTRLTQVGRALAQLRVVHIAAYSPEARGRSERMFGTLQDRLIKELALAGITEIEAANDWIKTVYLPAHNKRFMAVPALPDSAFVKTDVSRLTEALCTEDDRTVGRDNTIAWEGMRLQIPESPLRRHYVQAKVKVHAYPDGTLAVLHGPRVIGRYSGDGVLLTERVAQRSRVPEPANPVPTAKSAVLAASSVAARSSPSRRGLAAPAVAERPERRPSLTAPHRAAKGCQSTNRKTCPA
jgi:transposase